MAKRTLLAARREDPVAEAREGVAWEVVQSKSNPKKWRIRKTIAGRSSASAKKSLSEDAPIHPSIHPSVYSSVHSMIHFFVDSTIHWLIDSLVHRVH